MKWLRLLLWDPAAALDLHDRTGRIDHGKAMGALVFVLFVYLAVRESGWPPLAQLTAFLAATFGSRMFFRFLQRSSFVATAQTTRQVQEVLQRRMVDADGVTTEPSP